MIYKPDQLRRKWKDFASREGVSSYGGTNSTSNPATTLRTVFVRNVMCPEKNIMRQSGRPEAMNTIVGMIGMYHPFDRIRA